MSTCCDATARHFDSEVVARERRSLEKNGPGATTSVLVELAREAGIEGLTVLDVGAGLGAASEALLEAGATRATLVDVSEAYVRAARRRLGTADERLEYRADDFVAPAERFGPADLVVLDRVICCDPRLEPLLEAAAAASRRLIAASYPRDRRLVRGAIGAQNLLRRLKGDEFRAWVHPVATIRRALEERGFLARQIRRSLVWEMGLYERRST